MIIAIDGPAASGKGTLARRLAEHLDFAHLDTGRLYRAVGLAVVRAGGDPDDPELAIRLARDFDPGMLDDPELASDRAAEAASRVSAIGGVRDALVAFQRRFARHPPGGKKGAVLDGRDIGTVICPDADIKLYVTASPEVRAARRHKELLARAEPSIYARILADIKVRDARDRTRAIAPAKPADDAVLLDTTTLDPDAALAAALDHIAART
ncbi:MAG: (d)CMP kinase [Alphaproteobacteria bacterium]